VRHFFGVETFGNREKKRERKERERKVCQLSLVCKCNTWKAGMRKQKQRNRGRYGGSDNSIKSDQKKNVKHGGTWEGKRNHIR
jgi:hypothetical protein